MFCFAFVVTCHRKKYFLRFVAARSIYLCIAISLLLVRYLAETNEVKEPPRSKSRRRKLWKLHLCKNQDIWSSVNRDPEKSEIGLCKIENWKPMNQHDTISGQCWLVRMHALTIWKFLKKKRVGGIDGGLVHAESEQTVRTWCCQCPVSSHYRGPRRWRWRRQGGGNWGGG